MKHPDLAQPLCYGPEDWNKKYEKPEALNPILLEFFS